MIEIWKPVPGYVGWYEVSNLGNIKRIRPAKRAVIGKNLKIQLGNKSGYALIWLCKNGIQKGHLVSRLVCEAFHGSCPINHNCNHKDGVKSNNCSDNLEWVTHSDNCKHKFTVLGHSLANFHAANPLKGKKGGDHPYAKSYIVTTPSGAEQQIVGLKHFCRTNELKFGAMVQLATGSGHSHRHKGWKCRYK